MAFHSKIWVLISIIVIFNIYLATPKGSRKLFRLGRLRCSKHRVGGGLYAKDNRTLILRNFSYDGEAPDAFFYVGTKGVLPNGEDGIRLQHPPGSNKPLKKFNKAKVEVKLPPGLNVRDLKWFSVWCRKYAVNFGEVTRYARNRYC